MRFAKKLRKQSKKNKARVKSRRKVFFEALEPRFLLSADLSFTMTGTANDLTLRLDDANQEIQLVDNTDQSVLQSQFFADTRAILITGSDQDDTLTVDFNSGNPLPAGGLNFNAGTENDKGDVLRVVGDVSMTGSYLPDANTFGSGQFVIDAATLTPSIGYNPTIYFTGLEPTEVSNMSGFTLITPNSSDNLIVSAGSGTGGQNALVVEGTSDGVVFETLTIFNDSDSFSFKIDTAANDAGGTGNDTITIAGGLNEDTDLALNLTDFIIDTGSAGSENIDQVIFDAIVDLPGSLSVDNAETVDVNATIETGAGLSIQNATTEINIAPFVNLWAVNNVQLSANTITAGGWLVSTSGGIDLTATGNVTVKDIVASDNTVTVNDETFAIKIDAGGEVLLNGDLTATASSATDLNIDIDPVNVTVNGDITATGNIDIAASNDVTIAGGVEVEANSDKGVEGTLTITADDDANSAGDIIAADSSILKGRTVNLAGFDVTTGRVTAVVGDATITAANNMTTNGIFSADTSQVVATAVVGDVTLNRPVTAGTHVDINSPNGSVMVFSSIAAADNVELDGGTAVMINGNIGSPFGAIGGKVLINQSDGTMGTVTFQDIGEVIANDNILVSANTITAISGKLESKFGGVGLTATGDVMVNTIIAGLNTVNGNKHAIKINAGGSVLLNDTVTAAASGSLNIAIDPVDITVNEAVTATGNIDMTASSRVTLAEAMVLANSDGTGDGKFTINAPEVVVMQDADMTITNDNLTIASETVELSGVATSQLTGGDGFNTLDASAFKGAVTLNGGGGNDTLIGGGEADTLSGGPGDDFIFGDDGDDTFIWNSGDGSDTINGESGSDILILNGMEDTVAHTFDNANDGSILVDGDTITYTGLEPIFDNLDADTRVFTFSDLDDNIIVEDNGDLHDGISRIRTTGPTSESVDFVNPAISLAINTGGGEDTITINEVDSGFTASSTIDAQDFTDAPDPAYPTLWANNGARHALAVGLFLGASVDSEPDGLPSGLATGDDVDNSDDEDGVTFTSLLESGKTATVDVIASNAGYLHAWIDFNADGDWADAGEQIFSDQALAAGLNNLSFIVPATAIPTNLTFARFRFSTVGALSYDGPAPDGEVEDYAIEIKGVDFGDAPDPTYATLLASNGARHILSTGPFLGVSVDADADGQPSGLAIGDDTDGNDDEDGVAFTSLIQVGQTATIDVTATAPGLLGAWIDFNDDGDWADAGEQVFFDEPLSAGINSLSFSVPDTATPTNLTFARFRFSTASGLSFDGLAQDGEVEDYGIQIIGTELTIDDVMVAEGDGTGTTNFIFNVTRSDNTGAVSVDFETAEGTAEAGSDYTAIGPTSINFAAGGALTQQVIVPVNRDDMVELDETFFVNLMNPVGAIILDGTGQGTILNDDAATVGIDDVSLAEGDSGTTAMTFTVTLDHAVDVPVSVNSATADNTAVDGSDYSAAAGILNFTGTADESQTVSVDVIGDTLVERDETFFINLSSIAAGGRNVTFADNQGIGTIINDDEATISIDNVTMAEGNSPDMTDFIFTVTLDNDVDTAVAVDFATADGTATLSDSDYIASNGTLNFTGQAGEKQTRTIQVIGDNTLEGDEVFFVNLANIQADGRDVTLPDNPGLGTINNDDGGVALIGGTLFVIGTDGNDRVSISPKCNGLIKVYASFLSGRCHGRLFNAEDIQNIDIQLNAGNDRATISSKIDQPTSIEGGAGNDYLRAGSGWTSLDGGDGNDKLIGGRGDDMLIGGDGNDKLIGNDGNEILDGGAGDDRLYGGDGDDLLDGGNGNDLLSAGRGNDLILGGPGNDKAYGGEGNDLLFGGSGQDRLYGGSEDDLIFAGDDNDVVSGGRGNDTLFGGMGDDRLFGDQGDDQIFGDGGNDLIVGGHGDDMLDGGNGNDCLYGGCGDDVLTGGQGNDKLDGGFGNDELFGGRGDDKMYGGFGKDLLKGGAGDDKLIGGFGDDLLKGGRGDDLLDGGFGYDQLFGRRGDDTLIGGFGNDLLKGGAGDDKLTGGFGDDVLKGGRGDDKLIGGFGDDVLRGGRGDDLLIGGFGRDELFGGPGDDKLIDWSGKHKGFKFCGHHQFHKTKFYLSSKWIKGFVGDLASNDVKPNPNNKINLFIKKK